MNTLKQPLKIMLVVPSGLLRSSLEAHLRVVPEAQIIASVVDPLEALQLASQYQPDVILVDADLDEPVMTTLIQQIQEKFPAMNCIVLTDNIRQRSLARSCGARYTLLKGLLDIQLDEAIFTQADHHQLENQDDLSTG